jgi:hypothetical protein
VACELGMSVKWIPFLLAVLWKGLEIVSAVYNDWLIDDNTSVSGTGLTRAQYGRGSFREIQ